MKPGRKRKLVDEVCGGWQVSIRRACNALEFDRSTYHYKPGRSGQAALEQKIKEICHVRIRYGYRRVHVLLGREGWRHGQNKTRRIYRELGLQLRNKTPKRRVKAKLRDDRRPATRSNETWAMDFVHDQLATGHKLRVLTIIDTFSRFSPTLAPRFTFRGSDVAEVLERACKEVGFPARSGSIKAASSCRAILICGLTSAASRWTSRGPASQPTTHSSRPSMVASGPNASTPTGSCPLRTPSKKWRIGADTTMKNGPTGRSAIDR
ncbi:hypothetical protein J2R78_001395 [Bradyrhizobium sp. USDA 4538]|nr:hypothetical protein [Bradyrhizobium sp. USDA 4538]MCP1898992.1 hypothetical protein [Bradyrhizobium sp. USDA 4537]MCP1986894.1 hypothetical protein [Bradyrhizobium sp. USDA 4539]